MTTPTALLDGKVMVVSGSGDGLGRAVLHAAGDHGARLVVGDLDPGVVEARLGELAERGVEAVGRPTDVTDAAACQALAELAVDSFGAVDVLVNDAYHGGDYSAFADADLANWKATAEVNIWGTLQMTQAMLPHLSAGGDGRVVMICTHGVDLIQPTFGAYTGSKAALAHLTKLLAAELGERGIRVNAVYPGPIFGPALEGYLAGLAESSGRSVEDVHGEWAAKNALRYLVPPEQIAGSVVFLASDLSLPVTGQALYVNAGEVFH